MDLVYCLSLYSFLFFFLNERSSFQFFLFLNDTILMWIMLNHTLNCSKALQWKLPKHIISSPSVFFTTFIVWCRFYLAHIFLLSLFSTVLRKNYSLFNLYQVFFKSFRENVLMQVLFSLLVAPNKIIMCVCVFCVNRRPESCSRSYQERCQPSLLQSNT